MLKYQQEMFIQVMNAEDKHLKCLASKYLNMETQWRNFTLKTLLLGRKLIRRMCFLLTAKCKNLFLPALNYGSALKSR